MSHDFDISALGMIDAMIPVVCRSSAFSTANNSDSRVVKFSDFDQSVICGLVIRNNKFPLLKCLSKDTSNRFTDRRRPVVCWETYRDYGFL